MNNWPAAYSVHNLINALKHPSTDLAIIIVTIIIISVTITAYRDDQYNKKS